MADLVRAKVELIGCQSHTARGRTFKKGQPQTITNADDIAYYQVASEYSVQMLEAAPKKKAKAPAEDATNPSLESAVLAADERKRIVDDDEEADEGEGEDAAPDDAEDEGGGARKKKTKKRKSRA